MKEFLGNLKFLWQYAKGQKWNLLKFLILNILSIIINVVMPLVSAKQLLALTNNLLMQLVYFALIIFIISIINAIIGYISRGVSQKIFRNFYTIIQTEVGRQVLKLKNNILDEHGTGVFIQRLTNDSIKISEIFNIITFWGSNIVRDIGVYVALFILSKEVFFFAIISVLIMYLLLNRKSTLKSVEDKNYREKKEKTTGFVGEIVRGCRDIKMLNSENSFIEELNSKIVNMNKKFMDIIEVDRKYNLIINVFKCVRDFSLILLFVYLIKYQNYAVATVLILYNYRGQAFSIVGDMSTFLDLVKNFNLSANRVFEIMKDDEFEKEKFGTIHLDKVEGNFEFKNVHFSYNKNKVLKGINFKVIANETVAFVGRSGTGKTTIFNLLCKMYEANKGTITIDGVNIKKLDKDSIRGNITIISQNPYIFNLTIRDNLRLVKENLTEEEMIEACKMACLDEFIETLPDKYDTIIGEGGVNLSGGQKQRLAIARAFVQKTEIILFDEATSALDNETQSKIQQAIDNLKKDYTILIIAHRLSTIVNADRILLLNDGKIEAEGTHEELLEKSSEYRHLYESEIME